jgi:uncharacterized protein (TIGR00369 family)
MQTETIESRSSRQAMLMQMFASAPIIKTAGFGLRYDASGHAICTLGYNPTLDHGQGGIFGGILSSMLDIAGWFAVAPHYDNWLVTVEYSTRILEEVRHTDLWARGIPRKLGRSTAFADMEVYSRDDRLVATGSGTFRITNRPIRRVYDLG